MHAVEQGRRVKDKIMEDVEFYHERCHKKKEAIEKLENVSMKADTATSCRIRRVPREEITICFQP